MIANIDAAIRTEQVELVRQGLRQWCGARRVPEFSRARTAGAVMSNGEVAQRVRVFGHDAVVLDALDGVVCIERKELDERGDTDLREMQIGTRKRFELRRQRRRASRSCVPRIDADAR